MIASRCCVLVVLACTPSTKIAGDDAAIVSVDGGSRADVDVRDAAEDVRDAADPDACVAGDTWEAKIEAKNSLDVVVARSRQRATLYASCAQAGGGCGCVKGNPASLACEVSPSHAYVQIGTDDVSTSVDVRQRGDTIVANWEYGEFPGTHVTKKTEVVLTLPCAVHVRFVR